MKVARVTNELVFLECVDCGQEVSVLRKGIRRGRVYPIPCPNEDCISFWCPRIIGQLPAPTWFPNHTGAWRQIGNILVPSSSFAAVVAFFALESLLLGLFGIVLIGLFFTHRWRFGPDTADTAHRQKVTPNPRTSFP